jgi:two-component system, sensor histidine kinase
VKYTGRGGQIVIGACVRVWHGDDLEREMIAIDVADTGSGIPADQLESIFDEFSRLESHQHIPGSGLGLAVSKRIAFLLGGTITVESSSSGSTFTLWVPRDRREHHDRRGPDVLVAGN